ncbi:MAG: hypothetical protein JSV67_02700 [Thermoplasmatales archaeon]|nr:MAG: hypothetical protein JSV67_02700 [Thermoplasmatales archaeon]
MRDPKGRFVKGHAALPGRDPVTGRFIVKDSMDSDDKYSMVSKEVDMFLKNIRSIDEKR